ncbi:hypothetical protein HMPREF1247_0838 [Atopobium sp. BV3Ac4]|nr:hypothetical protein HMPREF1247_0838 [Atopobium sp. BV3Ac4]
MEHLFLYPYSRLDLLLYRYRKSMCAITSGRQTKLVCRVSISIFQRKKVYRTNKKAAHIGRLSVIGLEDNQKSNFVEFYVQPPRLSIGLRHFRTNNLLVIFHELTCCHSVLDKFSCVIPVWLLRIWLSRLVFAGWLIHQYQLKTQSACEPFCGPIFRNMTNYTLSCFCEPRIVVQTPCSRIKLFCLWCSFRQPHRLKELNRVFHG